MRDRFLMIIGYRLKDEIMKKLKVKTNMETVWSVRILLRKKVMW